MGSLGREVGVRIGNVSSCSTTKSWDKTLIFGIWFPNSHELFLRVLFFLGKRAEIPLSATFIHSKQHRMWTRVNTGCPKKMHQQNKQKWLNMAGLSIFQSGPKGSKTVQNGKPRCFWPFGTLIGPSGPFWTTSNEKWYSLKSTSAEPNFVLMGQQIDFCLKWSKRVQMDPKESQMVKNT